MEENKEEIVEEKKSPNKKKKIILISIIVVLVLLIAGILIYMFMPKGDKLLPLPKPEITNGARGELGIDKNINESNIDNYLFRNDAVYRDMRMLEDPGNYEKIGGDRFLSGYIDGFEVIPLPYIIPVTGLPEEVGETYQGNTLFYNDNGKYVANYEESMKTIEKIFPKDKVIFLMCGGGGYAGMTKNFLVSLGWDENKIYNVGGYWYYEGKHNISTKKTVKGEVKYDFSNVPYHDIKFDKLTKASTYKEPIIKVSGLKLNTTKTEIEEGLSFQLNVIVLPNDAQNKEVKWSSSDTNIATVDEKGLVRGIKEGTATITVETPDGKKKISCKVIVNKKKIEKVKIDNLEKEINEFSKYDLDAIYQNFSKIVDDPANKEKYYEIDEDGGQMANDAWRAEYDKYTKKEAEAQNKRIEIFNKLVDDKKSFIILVHSKVCEERDYDVEEGAARILSNNKYSYFDVGTAPSNGEQTLEKSKLDISNYKWGSIIIVKNGKIHASIDPEKDAIKDDNENKNWLSKYIDIK